MESFAFMQSFFDLYTFCSFINNLKFSNRELFLWPKFRKRIRLLLFSSVIVNQNTRKDSRGSGGLKKNNMDKITVFLIFLMWAILLLNRFYFNKKNNYFRNFNDKILFDASFYKLKIYNVSLIFGYILLGFNYLNLKLFLIHLAVFVLATIKLNKNSQDSSNS